MGTVFFVHHRILPVVKGVGFVSDRMSYIVLRGRWCNIILLNVHAPSEEKSDDSKDSVYENLKRVFDQMNILFEDFNAKLWRGYIQTDNWNKSLHQDSNDNGVRIVNICQIKIFSRTETLINAHGHLMGRLTARLITYE